MKRSTALLFISWIPFIFLFTFITEFNWTFLISIVLSLTGVWLLIKSRPKDSLLNQSVTPVVYIGALSVISGGISVFFLAVFYNPYSLNLNLILPYSLLLLIISLGGIRLVETLAKKKSKYKVITSIFISTLFLFTGYAVLAMIDYSTTGQWRSKKSELLLLGFFSLSSVLAILLGGYLLVLKKRKSFKLMIRYIFIAFCFLLCLGIPALFCIGKLLNIELEYFFEPLSIYHSLIPGIISTVILSTVLYLVWKEAQKEDKPYIPVLKFILASVFLLWQLNMSLRLYYDLPFALTQRFERDSVFTYFESLFTLKLLVFIVYIILNMLFFGGIFFKGKFKERQPLFFSSTGLLMMAAVFILLFGLVNIGQLLPYYPLSYLIIIPISFISVIGPVLMIAMVLVFLGGILSFFKKGLKQARFPGVVRKRGMVIAMSAVILYVLLFKTLWPFQDPAPDIFFGVVKNRIHRTVYYWGGIGTASYLEFVMYGKHVVMPLVDKLNDDEDPVRGLSAEFLMFLGDERAVEPLIKALKDRDKEVRQKAASALIHIKDPRAIEPLLQALGKNEIDHYTISALGDWGDHRFIDPLMEKLDDEDEEIRMHVIYALGNFKSVRVVDKLIESLRKEKASDVIQAFIIAFEKISGENYQGKKEKAADWWQQWWEKNRANFIKSRRPE